MHTPHVNGLHLMQAVQRCVMLGLSKTSPRRLYAVCSPEADALPAAVSS